MKAIRLLICEDDLAKLKRLVFEGYYPNKSEAIRLAVHDLVRDET